MSELSKRETKRLMNVIQDQIDTLLSYQGQIPLIEIDLVKNSIQQLYQQLDYISKPLDKNIQLENIIGKTDNEAEDLLNQAEKEFALEKEESEIEEDKTDSSSPVNSEDIEEKPSSPETSEENTPILEASEDKANSKHEVSEDKADQIKFEEEQSRKEKEKAIEKVEETKKTVEKKPQEKLKKPTDKRKQISIIDVISDEETSVGDQFQKSGIKDLKSAIGINDKFQFINDLFEGSMSEYNSFIKTIDNFESKQKAFDYLEEVSSKNKWSKENETFKLFKSYLERRY